jgi:hypothetical protein
MHIASSADGVLETVEQVAAMWDELRRLTPDMTDREFAPCPGHYERAAYCQWASICWVYDSILGGQPDGGCLTCGSRPHQCSPSSARGSPLKC